jgi:hypothetical protein
MSRAHSYHGQSQPGDLLWVCDFHGSFLPLQSLSDPNKRQPLPQAWQSSIWAGIQISWLAIKGKTIAALTIWRQIVDTLEKIK